MGKFWTKDKPKAKPKTKGRAVEVHDDDKYAAYVKEVVDVALQTTVRMLPNWQRQQFSGNVEPEITGDTCTITATLTDNKTGHKIVKNVRIVMYNVRANKLANLNGQTLGSRLVQGVERYFDQDKAYGNVPVPPKPKVDKAADMSEAMEVAKLLDRTRCVLCDYTDLQYPDWEDECSHTPEERAGE